MTAAASEPLWKQVVLGDTEPWRRGRVFLIVVGFLSLVAQGVLIMVWIGAGRIDVAMSQAIFSVVFWLLFYFIWIGVHWVRWLTGGWNSLYGFVLLIWGFRDGNGLSIAVGLYSFGIGCYMAFAPSVYFFAKRQRETVRWSQSIVIALGFLILCGTLAAGFVGLVGYKASVEREAHEFADRAFRRIFTEHDTAFFLEHASDRLKKTAGNAARLTAFLQHEFLNAGDVHNIAPATGSLGLRYSFPLRLVSEGQMYSTGFGEKSGIVMHMVVGDEADDWQIHEIGWHADPSLKKQ